ncbi:MAG: hypothetical protein ACI8XB_001624 [Patiriisocius sp.]|jgi:hypothetical protein
MRFTSLFLILLILLFGCIKDDTIQLDDQILSNYISLNNDRVLDDLIACAGVRMNGLTGASEFPTSVFFYPEDQVTDFRYFEVENVEDSLNFSQYVQKDLSSDPIFNGYLWKFNNTPFDGERMGVVTFKTPGRLHFCTPIR